jgi:DNA invertase Pin-like site-specific DNA recombinase
MESAHMSRAYSYLRFSTPEQSKGDSFRRQTSLARDYATRHGLILDDKLTFNDLGVSGFRGRNLEAGRLGDFLEAVRVGLVPRGSYLLVESLDRISRQAARKALRVLEDIVEEEITVVTLVDGKAYSRDSLDNDPMSLIMSLLIFIRANEESATKARRLKAAWEGKRARVKERPLTARAPAWLRLDRQANGFRVVHERATVVKRIYDMTLAGLGPYKVVNTLNGEGVPVFGRGRHWRRTYVLKILSNVAVVGTLIPMRLDYINGKRVRTPLDPVEGYYPAIVDPETFQRVQSLRRDSKAPLRGRHAAAPLQNLFGGLARCPVCGGSMTLVYKGAGNGKRYLVCAKAKAGAGCAYRAVIYHRVEEAFVREAGRVLGTVPAGDAGQEIDDKLAKVEAAIEGAEDGLERLLDAVQSGGTSPALAERIRDVEDELEKLRHERGELEERKWTTAGPLVARKLSDLEKTLSAPELDRGVVNAMLRQLLSAAVIDYRSGTVDLQWKHGGETSVTFGWPEEAQTAAR